MNTENIYQDIRNDLRRTFSKSNRRKTEKRVLQKMDVIKNRQTKSGKSPARGGQWNNRYSMQYAKRAKGGRRSPVTLRQNQRSIEKTKVKKTKEGSALVFTNRDKAIIFNYHDKGTAKGGKTRQIYPRNDKQVPVELDKIAERSFREFWNKT